MKMIFELPKWMRGPDVERCTGIPMGTLRQLVRDRDVHAKRLGGKHCAVVFFRPDVENWIAGQPDYLMKAGAEESEEEEGGYGR